MDAKDIRNHIERFLMFRKKERGLVQIAFYGGNFLGISRERATSLLRGSTDMVREGSVQEIRVSTRPDSIREEALDFLSGYPVSTVELGVQSLNDHALETSQRGHTSQDSYRAIRLLKERGYRIGVQIMVGLPGDSEFESIKTAEKIADLAPDAVRIYPTVVLRGSLLAKWHAEGKYVPMPLGSCVSHVKELYLFFTKKNIRVIRMGLQASETLAFGRDLLAGPYHPAFGHLVFSEIILDAMVSHLNGKTDHPQKLSLRIHPKNRSRLNGLKSRNIEVLQKRFNLQAISVVSDPVCPEDHLVINDLPLLLPFAPE